MGAFGRVLDHLVIVERVARGGIRDGGWRVAAAGEAELYVSKSDADSVARKWMLVSSDRPNVRMHVVDELPDGSIPLAWILADLAERGGPRESQQVRELLRGASA